MFLGPEFQNICWPITIKELGDHLKTARMTGKWVGIKKREIHSSRSTVPFSSRDIPVLFLLGYSRFFRLNGQHQKTRAKKNVLNNLQYEKTWHKTVCFSLDFQFIYTIMQQGPWLWLASKYFGWIEILGPRTSTNVITHCLPYCAIVCFPAGHKTSNLLSLIFLLTRI